MRRPGPGCTNIPGPGRRGLCAQFQPTIFGPGTVICNNMCNVHVTPDGDYVFCVTVGTTSGLAVLRGQWR